MALKDESYYRTMATTMRGKAEQALDRNERNVLLSVASQYDTLAKMATLSPTRTMRRGRK